MKVSHADLGKARIKKDESDVACLVDLMENNWTNPFGSDPSDLVSISTGAVATSEVSTGLLTAHKQGEETYSYSRGSGFKREWASIYSNRRVMFDDGINHTVVVR